MPRPGQVVASKRTECPAHHDGCPGVPVGDVDLLYDALVGLLMKFRRVPLGPSLDRWEHPGRQVARVVGMARELLSQDIQVVDAVRVGLAPPNPELDDDIPF